jgi:hypothetical protein
MWGSALLVLDGDKIMRDERIMAAGAQLYSCNGCAHSERPLWDSRNQASTFIPGLDRLYLRTGPLDADLLE